MSDPAPDLATSSKTPETPETHVPWDSIGATDEAVETGADPDSSQDIELPLTPWAERSAAPDSQSAHEESEAAPHFTPEDEEDESEIAAAEPSRSRVEPEEPPARGGGWTISVLCAGIALIACCVLIPQADANRRLAYERETLQRDMQNITQQIQVNQEFLRKVSDDPTLAQRLAERQMKVIPEGEHVVDLTHEPEGMSPFQLVNVAPPAPLPPYRPVGGTLARICYGPHSRLYLIGMSLGLIATGLVLGASPQDARK
jgi:hypothetical protein